jgi:poly-gamma-glutamate synthesis protein (capsule biosynthesis protein)
MRLPARPHIALVAVTAAAALAAGCTSSGNGASAPTSRQAQIGVRTVVPKRHTSSAAPTPTRPPGVYTISFAGDVNFAGRTLARLRQVKTAFGQAAPGLRRADLTMVNLETAVTNGGVQQNKEFTFRAPPEALTALKDAGVDVATMANNHGADYGLPGLRDTFRAIRTHHLPVIGIGRDADAAFAPYRTTLNGVKVAIFAADQVQDETTLPLFSAGPGKPGVANAYQHRLVTAVHAAVRRGEVVVVYLHWGIEYTTCPSSDQSTLAGALARAGASAVIGTHAHVLQGAGWAPDGTYVAYGLGNYLWWMSFGNIQDDNGVLTLTFHRGKVVHAHFAASHLDDRGIPVPATGSTKARIDAEWSSDRGCANLSAHRP